MWSAKSADTYRALKKSTRTPTNVSNAKLAVRCSIFLLRIRNHVLTYLVGPTALEKKTKSDYQKEKLSPLMRQYIRQAKLSTTYAEEANIKLVPKGAKILLYVEQSCHAPIVCFIAT